MFKYIHFNKQLSEYVESFHKKSLRKLKILQKTFSLPDAHIQISFSEGLFLQTFLKCIDAKNVLEIGTFRGFSSYFLFTGLKKSGKLTTIEADIRNIPHAKILWQKLNISKNIELKEGKAIDVLKILLKEKRKFDAVFIDADKRNDKVYVEYAHKLTRKGGIIFIDNALWKGKVVDKKVTRTSVVSTQKCNEFVFKKYKNNACLIPAWDGIILIRKT